MYASLSTIDLRLIRVFLDVAEHEGFSPAAEARDTSLSTITRDISALETRLGLKLCRRGRGGFGLTPDGEEILQASRKLMQDVKSFETSVTAAKSSLPEAFEIGIIDDMVSNPDCPVIEVLQALNSSGNAPSLRVNVHPMETIDYLVRSRRLDIGFTAKQGYLAPLEYRPCFTERHALFVSRNCPEFKLFEDWNAGDRPVSLPYVRRTFGNDALERFEARMPFETRGVGSSLEGVLTAVAAGFGAGILPRHAARRFSQLVEVALEGSTIDIPFNVIIRRDMVGQGLTGKLFETFQSLMEKRK